jgi:hypothetical protein
LQGLAGLLCAVVAAPVADAAGIASVEPGELAEVTADVPVGQLVAATVALVWPVAVAAGPRAAAAAALKVVGGVERQVDDAAAAASRIVGGAAVGLSVPLRSDSRQYSERAESYYFSRFALGPATGSLAAVGELAIVRQANSSTIPAVTADLEHLNILDDLLRLEGVRAPLAMWGSEMMSKSLGHEGSVDFVAKDQGLESFGSPFGWVCGVEMQLARRCC